MPGKDVHRHTAEMGYWLAEPFWGKGIMTQAVKCMTAYAIRELKMLGIYAEPYTTYPASVSVLKKAGFVCEGILHSNVLKNGKVLDQFLYPFRVRPQRFSQYGEKDFVPGPAGEIYSYLFDKYSSKYDDDDF